MTEEEKSRGLRGGLNNHGLPHWSEPATGQFPKVEVSQSDEPNEDWEALSDGPEWVRTLILKAQSIKRNV